MYKIDIGDKLILRKKHPCGNAKWEVWKLGINIGVKCLGCGRKVKIPRFKLEKQIRRQVTEPPIT